MTRRGNLDPAQAIRDALAHLKTGNAAAAEQIFETLLRQERDNFDALHNLGVLRYQAGRFDEGLALVRKALRRRPNSAMAHNTMGLMLRMRGRAEEALACHRRAIVIEPGYAEAHHNLGNALYALNRLEEAASYHQAALDLKPGFAEPHIGLGGVLHGLRRYDEALAHHETALALRPDLAEAHCNAALALNALNRPHEALAHYRKALTLKPGLVVAQLGMASVLRELGRIAEAERICETVIASAPRSAAAYHSLGLTKRFAAGDPHIQAMQALERDATLSGEDRIRLLYALAKADADLGEHARSLHRLIEANAMKRKTFDYDETIALGAMERSRAVFTPELMRAKSGLGDTSDVPVFIVGMARSGTTLVEQILASHPAVHGAGERWDFEKSMTDAIRAAGVEGRLPEAVASLSGEQIAGIGRTYLRSLGAAAPKAARITDKMPDNFHHLGLIHLALPNARIIHACRDPLDTCLSCFAQLFDAGYQLHTYDLGELGRHYRAYRTLMAHWRDVLPDGAMIDVRYEDVVGDLEGQARRIVAHCGLAWDDACLAFHRSERPVNTASVAQVRQPIYSSSVGRAQGLEDQLRPLIEALA
ncbi:MAG TPA: sulfotransferase [Stellaceae bacterium]|nr:sulfotransferase [Stellaceae bacterium]